MTARTLAVADSSTRSPAIDRIAPHMEPQQVLEIVRADRGKAFCADVVDAAETVLRSLDMAVPTAPPSPSPTSRCVWYISTFGTMKERLIKRFEQELSALDREFHTELPKEIQRARELGDLRENAEYQAAKERQTYVNARMAMLKRRMNEIALMNMDRIPHGKAGFGSTVTLQETTGGGAGVEIVVPTGDAGRRGRRKGDDLHVVADRQGHSEQRGRRHLVMHTGRNAEVRDPQAGHHP